VEKKKDEEKKKCKAKEKISLVVERRPKRAKDIYDRADE